MNMNQTSPLEPWYALHVRSRREKTVLQQLEAKQLDAFLPLYAAKHRWADRWKSLALPLFPGYVFCRFDPGERTRALTTAGVIDVVRTGGEPAPVPESEIDAIRILISSPFPLEPYPDLVAGQTVRMSGGPLSGLSGTLAQIRNSFRLVVSVELLHRSVLVEVDREWAVPCGDVPTKLSQRNVTSSFPSIA